MTELTCIKLPNGSFAPADEASREEAAKFKVGQPVRFKATRKRNYQFHRKYFALLQFAFDHWTPGELQDPKYPGIVPEKNFERFRKDLIILAGFYDATFRIDGTTRIEAKSISFSAMSQDDFDKLYSATIDAVLKHILTHYEREELEGVVLRLLEFD